MKKLLMLLLVLSILLSSISCASNDNGQIVSATTQPSASALSPSNQPSTEPATPFYAGYSRVSISPDKLPIVIFGNANATYIVDDICATVVAVSDGKNKALFISLDLQYASGKVLLKTIRTAERYGVPEENVFVNATHNHSGVHYDDTQVYEMCRWYFKYYDAIEKAIKAALDDLTPTTAEIGTAQTPNMNYVRRYYMKDGSTHGIGMPKNKSEYDRHETEADTELQVIRFNRENARDIVMVNWQAHAAHAVGILTNHITADFIHNFREGSEEKYDVHFAYFQGACGNINFTSNVHGSKSYLLIGKELVDILGEALQNMTPVKLGSISSHKKEYTATIDHSMDKFYEHAINTRNDFNEYIETYGKEMSNDELYSNYGFFSKYHFYAIITRHNSGETLNIPISAISFGELGFASTPYEMFDTNGMQVKDGSPFKMTFMCAYTNGSYGYVPSAAVYDNGGYEVYSTRFIKGTGDDVANELINMLKSQHSSQTTKEET